jgi:hypothetical protein
MCPRAPQQTPALAAYHRPRTGPAPAILPHRYTASAHCSSHGSSRHTSSPPLSSALPSHSRLTAWTEHHRTSQTTSLDHAPTQPIKSHKSTTSVIPSSPLAFPLHPDPDQASAIHCPPEPLPPIPVTHLPRSPSRNCVLSLLLALPNPTNCSTLSKPSNNPSTPAPYPLQPPLPPHLPRFPSSLGEAPVPSQSSPLTHRPRSPSPFSPNRVSFPVPRPPLPSQSSPIPHLPRSPSPSPTPP